MQCKNCADIIEDLYSPRTAAMDFVSELVRKRGKENLQKFIQFIVGIFSRCVTHLCQFRESIFNTKEFSSCVCNDLTLDGQV